MGTAKDSRDAQLAALLEEGRSYQDVAEIADMKVPALKAAIRKKYPELYQRLRSPRGLRPMTNEEVEQLQRRALQHRQTATELAKRKREITDHFFADPFRTLQETGDEFGVTREYVRQLASITPARYAAKREARRTLREKAQAKPPRSCKTCGCEITASRKLSYCCEEHRIISTQYLRYHLDDEFRQRHYQTVARWWMKDGNAEKVKDEKVREQMLRYQRRVLAGEEIESHGRWFIHGSKAMMAGVEAYRQGWPIFAKLPQSMQDQVRDFVAGTDSPDQ